MNFERSRPDIHTVLGLGHKAIAEKWFDQNNQARGASHKAKDAEDGIIMDVSGDLVLETFNINEDKELYIGPNVKIGSVSGNITILSLLSEEEIYNRIKDYFILLLSNCLGKTVDQQSEIVLGKDRRVNLKTGLIEESEAYIRNLPKQPTKQQLIELAENILSGKHIKIEYAFWGLDKYSVFMKQYAERLHRIILNG